MDDYSSGKDFIFNLPLLIITFVTGIIVFAIDYVLFEALKDSMPYVVLIALLYFILFAAIVLVTYLTCRAQYATKHEAMFGDFSRFRRLLIIALVGSFPLAMLFQFIYSLEGSEDVKDMTSIVFVLDNSSSITTTDPDGLRYDAIEQLAASLDDDFPYMIYTFCDDGFGNGIEIIRDMLPASQQVDIEEPMPDGGTPIKGVLTRVLDDYKSGVWDGGDSPRIVLLTDGYPTDFSHNFQINSVLRDYSGEDTTISVIGLLGGDDELMQQIADRTGGVFIRVDDAAQLYDAMDKASENVSTYKQLYGYRNSAWHPILFGILRVVFLTVLGGIMAVMVAGVCYYRATFDMTAVAGVIMSFIGALMMEIGTQLVGLNPSVMWCVMWLLFATVVAVRPIRDAGVDIDSEYYASGKAHSVGDITE